MRAMRGYWALLSVLLLSILLLQPLLALAAQERGEGPLRVDVSVEDYVFTLRVYPDGAVEPIIGLNASAELSKNLGLNLSVRLSYSLFFTEQVYEEKTVLLMNGTGPGKSATVPGVSPILPGNLSSSRGGGLEAGLGGTVFIDGKGGLVINASGQVVVERNNTVEVFTLNRLVLEKKGSYLRLSIRGETNSSTTVSNSTYANPREFFEKLRKAGIDFLKLESLVAGVEGNRSIIDARLAVDLDRLIAYALSKGLSPSDVDNVREILSMPYRVSGFFNATLSAGQPGSNRTAFLLAVYNKYTGDIGKAYRELAEKSNSLQKFLLVVIAGINDDLKKLEEHGKKSQPLAPLIASAPLETPRLMFKPPVDMRTEFSLKLAGNKTHIHFAMSGGRYVYYPSTGSPGRDAERTLMEIGRTLTKTLQLISQLKALLAFTGVIVSGAEKLVPEKIKLEPASPAVHLSKTLVKLNDIGLVRVNVTQKNATTPTTTQPPSTGQPTGTSTTPTTTTSKAVVSTSTTTSAPQGSTTAAQGTSSGTTASSTPGTGSNSIPLNAAEAVQLAIIVLVVVVIAAALIALRKR